VLLSVAAVAAIALLAHADWLQPDPSYKEAQLQLRLALRDTVGQPDNVARLDTLGVALMRLGRIRDAHAIFERVLALNPGDNTAEAALGKLALFADHPAEAESLLTAAGTSDVPLNARAIGALPLLGSYDDGHPTGNLSCRVFDNPPHVGRT
jgi:Flp pilus assembly protein TadD